MPTTTKFMFGKMREVVYSYREDDGGMFESTCGVIKGETGYHAFVQSGWGSGVMSRTHPDLDTAKADIERLWRNQYGG